MALRRDQHSTSVLSGPDKSKRMYRQIRFYTTGARTRGCVKRSQAMKPTVFGATQSGPAWGYQRALSGGDGCILIRNRDSSPPRTQTSTTVRFGTSDLVVHVCDVRVRLMLVGVSVPRPVPIHSAEKSLQVGLPYPSTL